MTKLDFLKPDYLLFLKAAEFRSFSKVADQMSLTQPKISKSIRRLENELGYSLFARKNTGVELTHNGAALFEELRALLEQQPTSKEPQLSFGGHRTVLQTYLPKLLTPLLSDDLSIQWRVHCATSLEITHMVNQLQLDFGIVVNPIKASGLIFKKLGTDYIGLWSKTKKPSHWLCYNPEMFGVQELLRSTNNQKLLPINDYQVIYELVRTGECSGLLPNTLINHKEVTLVGEKLREVQISLIYHSENRKSPLFREFLRRMPTFDRISS